MWSITTLESAPKVTSRPGLHPSVRLFFLRRNNEKFKYKSSKHVLCCVASSGCGCCYCRGDAIARRPAGCMMMSSSIDWGVVAQWGKYETRVASHRSIPFVSCPSLSSVCVCFCVSVTQWVFRGRSLHPLWWMDSNCSFVWRPNTPPPPPPTAEAEFSGRIPTTTTTTAIYCYILYV